MMRFFSSGYFIATLVLSCILETGAFTLPSNRQITTTNMIPAARHRSKSYFHFGRNKRALKAENDDEREKSDDNKNIQPQDPFFIEEPRLLICDLLAILVTTQLVFLTHVLQQSSFWDNGGFIQAITFSSFSSLGDFMRTDSLLSLCWICSALYNRGYGYAAFVDDLQSIKSSLQVFVDFCSLLIISKILFASLDKAPVDPYLVLTEAWFVIFVVGTFRFAYSRANRF